MDSSMLGVMPCWAQAGYISLSQWFTVVLSTCLGGWCLCSLQVSFKGLHHVPGVCSCHSWPFPLYVSCGFCGFIYHLLWQGYVLSMTSDAWAFLLCGHLGGVTFWTDRGNNPLGWLCLGAFWLSTSRFGFHLLAEGVSLVSPLFWCCVGVVAPLGSSCSKYAASASPHLLLVPHGVIWRMGTRCSRREVGHIETNDVVAVHHL